jgi:creatinine amidohydrolase/Fe(II)-dependent formamide hydrolase-like protein
MAKARDREVTMKRLCLLAVLLFIAGPVYGQGSSQGLSQGSSPASSVWIDDLTWPEVQDAIAAGKRTAIIYAGSSEQNGPHMVIGKHNFIARALAQRIAEELGDALVYPVLPYAITGNALTRTGHMRFPGSVSLPPEAFFGVVRGVAQSALTAGFKVVALMGDHGGGQDELALAAKELDGEVRASSTRVLFIGDLYAKSRVQMRDILAKRGLPTDEDHAGIPDTSSLLYLETQGQWVRKDKIALADPKNGVRGHPQQASAELGKIYLDLKVDLAVKQIRSLLAASK